MRDPLFEPIKINNLELKNRIYLPAMHMGMAVDFQVTDQLVDFYAERAKGGAGMIVVGNATVDEVSGFFQYIGAHSDAFIPGLTRLANAIKDNGAKAAVQLNHAGRYSHSALMGGKKPVAPTALASNLTREVPEELDIKGIKAIVESFAQAALRVKKCGYDAVEVLSGTGYLISEFLSPVTNKREDEYGGSFENRMRFGIEVMTAIRKALGPDFPLIVRMDNNDFMEGGMRHGELGQYAVRLVEECGVNALCVKGSWHEARVPQLTSNVPRGTYAYLARNIKNLVNVPVIASHRINDPHIARELIQDGYCDMVAMARSLIADPYLPEKARTGRENEIIHCIGCAQGCFDNLFKLQAVECLCNPMAGHERERAILKTDTQKKIMVVGGGAAGMSAALAAFDKGHAVSLYEKSDRLGGQLFLAALPPGREEFAELAKDLSTQISLRKIPVHLNTEVNAAVLDQEKPDAVILATGAKPLKPPIPGVDLPHVVQAWDVLSDRVSTGTNVVVIGGGAVGVETALFLSEKGTLPGEALKFLMVNRAESFETLYDLATRGSKNVTIIEMMGKVGAGIGKSTKWVMMQDMARNRISVKVGTKALEITEKSVKIQTDDRVDEILADTVVIAAGAVPVNELALLLKEKDIPCMTAGDARQIALAFDAVHQGHEAGRTI
ncbi:MAG: FAD-dependent oxidoreductase [Proteobacteria bacterium]|nr:FAD-dependent oxidoreductase [Pseudomonadota bacterium]